MHDWGDTPPFVPMRIRGDIHQYGLTEWWLSALTEAERAHLVTIFRPMGVGPDEPSPLIEGEWAAAGPMETPGYFLSNLTGWVRATPEGNAIRRKIRSKMAELVAGDTSCLSRHFTLGVLIKDNYRDRNRDPHARQAAVQACRDQISIAPEVARMMLAGLFKSGLPGHKGYTQIAIILAKDGSYSDAIDLCRRAQAGGWAGTWEKRISRWGRKLE